VLNDLVDELRQYLLREIEAMLDRVSVPGDDDATDA
jgi:hypothetical protein